MPSPTFLSIAWPYLLAALAFGYALGSIPFGLLLMTNAPTQAPLEAFREDGALLAG